MALSVIEDLESGKEFERIKQNFTSTPPDPDALANLAQTHNAFEDLQSELHDFLAQYMDKVVGLQARIATSLTTTISHNSDGQRTVIPTANSRMSHHSADAQNGIDDGLSDRRISAKPPLKVENFPLDAHLHNLQIFLNAQMENIRRLHDASHSSIAHKDKEERATGEEHSDKPLEGPDVNVDFNVTLAIFVFMAALIVVFLLLVITIIGTKHRTPFSVAMFFCFLSLAALFIGMFTVRQGLGILGTAEKRKSSGRHLLFTTIGTTSIHGNSSIHHLDHHNDVHHIYVACLSVHRAVPFRSRSFGSLLEYPLGSVHHGAQYTISGEKHSTSQFSS